LPKCGQGRRPKAPDRTRLRAADEEKKGTCEREVSATTKKGTLAGRGREDRFRKPSSKVIERKGREGKLKPEGDIVFHLQRRVVE